MAEKKNYWTQIWEAMNGALSFGSLSPLKDVTSSAKLEGTDARHFITMDEDGVREGWTTINAPGAIQLNAGEDLTSSDNGFFINSENGDVIIRADNGKVRIEGTNIEFVANGNAPEGIFWVRANDSVKIDAKNITLEGKQSLRLLTSGVLSLNGRLCTEIISPIIEGVSCATNPNRKPGQF